MADDPEGRPANMAARPVRDHYPPGDHDDVEASATIADSSPAVATFAAGDDNEDLHCAPGRGVQRTTESAADVEASAIVAAGSSPAVGAPLADNLNLQDTPLWGVQRATESAADVEASAIVAAGSSPAVGAPLADNLNLASTHPSSGTVRGYCWHSNELHGEWRSGAGAITFDPC